MQFSQIQIIYSALSGNIQYNKQKQLSKVTYHNQ